jgi:class 3 adenylate cyclase
MAASPGRFVALCRMWFDNDVRALLPSVDVPTLVIHATDDHLVRVEHGRYLAEHIRHAHLVELPDADHLTSGDATELALHAIEEFICGGAPGVPAERVLATVAFVDVTRSTETVARLGDHTWQGLLDAFRRLVRRQLDRHGGREVDTRGDDFLALFDIPARAIAWAIAVRTDARSLGLDVTAGIHTGELERQPAGVAGITVHIGARIAALAAPGDILVSSIAKDLVTGAGLRFVDRGAHELKGVPQEWRVFAVET